MKNVLIILLLLKLGIFPLIAQSAGKDYVKRYTQAQVIDSTEGMLIYNRMMQVLAADYEQLKSQGSTLQGWNEEYYDNGQLMHISYYKEGRLVLFKNFFENGQCQHNITYPDAQNCNIDVYFENGGLKNQLHFCAGLPKKLTEFFASGLPKSQIEFDTDTKCLSSRRSWYLNAEVQSEVVLQNPGQRRFIERTFYPNGQIKEEGELVYIPENKDYIKAGTWQTFESSGKKKTSEKFKLSLSSN